MTEKRTDKRTDKRTKTHACDCISRQDAIETSLEFFVEFLGGALHENAQKELIARFQRLPPAQPEIIRCKDCRWRKDQSGSTAWLPCRAIVTPSDFYCGRAERRTDE